MSIIESGELGWLLDHKKSIEETYNEVLEYCSSVDNEGPQPRTASMLAHSDMFAIHLPFMMDSQFEAHVKEIKQKQAGDETQAVRRKRKRKIAVGDDAGTEYHTKVVAILKKALEQLLDLGRSHFSEIDENARLQLDNNIKARELASKADSDSTFMELIETKNETTTREISLKVGCVMKVNDLLDVRAVNSADKASIVMLSGEKYVIPLCSSFLLSDVSNHQLLAQGVHYDLIVLDPPWENKSVKRKRSYRMLRDFELEDIPVGELAADGCLVATWVTNKQQQQRLVRETLYPKWGITPLAMWYWLKVTTLGEPVYPLTDQHSKKPYEALIIGRKAPFLPENIPDEKVLLSIPSCVHSHKPPLQEVLKNFLSCRNPKCLEIFARNLQPGWTSWGNEVIKLQREHFFTRKTKKE